MSDTNETISAILADYRADIPAMTIGEMQHPTPEYLRILLDRIEAAARWESEINQKILAAANEANAILKDDRDRAIQFANAAPHPGSVSWKEMHEVYAKARAILSAVPKEVNAAAMRSALEELVYQKCLVQGSCGKPMGELCTHTGCIWHPYRAALAAPARNCDRFTTLDEAREAFQDLRGHKILADVELWDSMDEAGALVRWLFAPAEEGGAK